MTGTIQTARPIAVVVESYRLQRVRRCFVHFGGWVEYALSLSEINAHRLGGCALPIVWYNGGTSRQTEALYVAAGARGVPDRRRRPGKVGGAARVICLCSLCCSKRSRGGWQRLVQVTALGLWSHGCRRARVMTGTLISNADTPDARTPDEHVTKRRRPKLHSTPFQGAAHRCAVARCGSVPQRRRARARLGETYLEWAALPPGARRRQVCPLSPG